MIANTFTPEELGLIIQVLNTYPVSGAVQDVAPAIERMKTIQDKCVALATAIGAATTIPALEIELARQRLIMEGTQDAPGEAE